MKIVHLTTVHYPFDTRIFHRQCRTLAQSGYEVVLIAVHDRDVFVDGVRVLGMPRPRNRLARMTTAAWRLLLAALRQKADVYQFHDAELIPVGIALRVLGKTVVYDVHEDVPRDILMKDYLSLTVRRVLSPLASMAEALGTLFFNGIIAVTRPIARRFPAHKTVMVQNFPRLGELDIASPVPYALRPPLAAYVGIIAEIRSIREMIQSMALLPEQLEARLTLAGNFQPPELLEEMKAQPGWVRVDYLGPQSRPQVGIMLGRARLGIVLFHSGPNHDESQPNKLFEYMSAGLPVVASDFPHWRTIVVANRCGLLVSPNDPGAIARAIQYLLDNPVEAEAMGRRGRQAVQNLYNWEQEAVKLLAFYQHLARQKIYRGLARSRSQRDAFEPEPDR